jgi:2-keto-4-pentenoate hydratase/2-oxohepta-3-ene-1,7-dioic acid hydratase in catechol pathway
VRLARIEYHGDARIGTVDGGAIRLLPVSTDILELLAMTVDGRRRIEQEASSNPLALGEQRLLAPLEPRSIRDFTAFEAHLEGTRPYRDSRIPDIWYEIPGFYFTNVASVTGPYDDIPRPFGSTLMDFELEVAVVIAREGADLSIEAAADHIGGYMLFNDWSARDIQLHEMQLGIGPCKGKDFANTLGPWLVTPDELERFRDGDRLDLDLTAAVNGQVIAQDSLASMSWSFAELIAYASRGTRVLPGDVIGSGTCGWGCLIEHWGRGGFRYGDGVPHQPPPLQPGDVVTLAAGGLGKLENRIVEGAAPVALAPRARRRGQGAPRAASPHGERS